MQATATAMGLWMLVCLGVATLATGLPVWSLLIGVASLFAALGVAMGAMDMQVLTAVSARVLGLLDNDLLQALPLYVFVGLLLNRMGVAEALFDTFSSGLQSTRAGQSLATLGVGAMIAPMNGSVASSSALLSRLLQRRQPGGEPSKVAALISVAATVGVVVPPSLVLILLGDAMMHAHTEASNMSPNALGHQRIINTQDVFHAALLPGAVIVVLWALVAAWQGRSLLSAPSRVALQSKLVAAVSTAAVVMLLAGVYTGQLFAVEAAATGGVVLMLIAVLTRRLSLHDWRELLDHTLSLTGALIGLLVGATVFSLVFRLYSTDVWLAQTIVGTHFSHSITALLVLVFVGLCAWVLDAFEMVFVIIPVVAPPLVVLLQDAQQVAVLLLLVLQASFLIPPMGYAVMMARAQAPLPVSIRALAKALAPYLGSQVLVIAVVFGYAPAVHFLDAQEAQKAPETEVDLDAQMRAMSDPAVAEGAVKPDSEIPAQRASGLQNR